MKKNIYKVAYTRAYFLFFPLGTYKISEAQGVKEGTKVIIHLKEDCAEFSDYNKVRDIIKKYSSFVGSTLYLGGEKASDLQPVWLMDPKKVESETHEDFYRYISNAYDKPRFVHHFRADAPMGKYLAYSYNITSSIDVIHYVCIF